MSSDFKFELNSEGVKELLKSEGAKSICMMYAEDICDACGDGYEVQDYESQYRKGARVHAAEAHAYYSNLKHNTLLKNLQAFTGGKK